MSRENKTVLGVLTAAAVLVPVVLAVGLSWPVWLWLVVVLIALSSVAVTGKYLHDRHVQQQRMLEFERRQNVRVEPKPEPEPLPDPTRHPLTSISLPSSERHYRFLFAATICWRQTRNGVGVPYTNPRSVADDLIVTRAREVVASEAPHDVVLAQHRLSSALSEWLRDRSGHVEAYAEEVSLTLPEKDADRLRRLSEAHKDEQVWEREKNYERNRRAYLRDEVLQDTGSALVWLLAQEAEDQAATKESVVNAVEVIGKIARLSSIVNDTAIPAELQRYLDPADEPAAETSTVTFHNGTNHSMVDYGTVSEQEMLDHLVTFVRRHGGKQDELLAHQLITLIEAGGSRDLADALRRELTAGPDSEIGRDETA